MNQGYSMFRFVAICIAFTSVRAFHVKPHTGDLKTSILFSSAVGDVPQQQVFPIGTFVEFQEKKRAHVGKIVQSEHKSNGGARYDVVDSEGKKYGIADKAVLFAMNAPNTPGAATKLFNEFCDAYQADEQTLQTKLDVSTELLEMAWEESEGTEDHVLTASQFVELILGHAASTIENYMAWKLLKSETSHVFFKEIKDHGRVVAFKGKARKAVDAAKQSFCLNHADSELCLV
jgi:hypothetical protein